MQGWLAKGRPVESTEKMIAWYAGLTSAQQSRLTQDFRSRVTELRLVRPAADGGKSASLDPEYADFERVYQQGGITDQTALAELKKQAAFYQYKQRACSSRNDHAGASAALNQLKDLAGVIHDMELRAQKLGRDLGDLVPRKTLEDPARFLGYHLLRCADAAREQIVAALRVSDPAASPLLPEEIRARIDPILLDAFVLQPIRRASQGDNQAAPPDWLVAALTAGASEVLEGFALDHLAVPVLPVA